MKNLSSSSQAPSFELIDEGAEFVSPALATEWLKNVPTDNIKRMSEFKNRRRIERYKRAMLTGRWMLHHQGLLFGKDRLLLDGVGRMMAVAESGVSCWFKITYAPQIVNARDLGIDSGLPRDAAYILQAPSALVKASKLAFFIVCSRAADDIENEPFVARFASVFADAAFMSSRKHAVATSGIVLGAVLRIATGDATSAYITSILDAFGRRDPKVLPPLPYAFYRQYFDRRLDTRQQLMRAYRAFSEADAEIPMLLLKEDAGTRQPYIWAEIKEVILRLVPEWRKA